LCATFVTTATGGVETRGTLDTMTSKVDPPQFMDDAAGYPEYKKKLLRWSRITKVPKEQQAEVVLYNLDGHPSGIQDKVDTYLGDNVQKADGLEKLIEYLDSIYSEDPMSEAWSKYKRFNQLMRDQNQSVTEFIAEFDKGHAKAKESGCEFSDLVLGFKLLESCNLSETDEKFVLTAVDFKVGKDDKNLLEQMKNSLRKFQSREKFSGSTGDNRMSCVKQEDAFYVTSVKEALVAEGWTPPDTRDRTKKKHKNPRDKDGKRMRCFRCNSEYHFKDKCDVVLPTSKDKCDAPPLTEPTLLSTLLKNMSTTEYEM
jgi:hypothetical protein